MRKLILLLFLSLPAFGALSATIQWDVRTTGSNSNSGGFDPGVSVPGTDYSQQNSPQITYTDLVVGATTTQFTSVLHVVSSALPGNTLLVTGGTGCTTGTYEILSNSTITATVDRSLGTAASVCTAVLGGSFAGPLCTGGGTYCTSGLLSVGGNTVWVSGQTIWFKAGTYSWTSWVPNYPNSASPFIVTYAGYNSTHGDITLACIAAATCTRPLIQNSTTHVFYVQDTAQFLYLEISQGNSSDWGIVSAGSWGLYVTGCKFDGPGIYAQYGYAGGNQGEPYVVVASTEFNIGTGEYGIEEVGNTDSGGDPMLVYWSYFHGGAAGIWDNNAFNWHQWTITGNVFSGSTRGVYMQSINDGSYLNLSGNSFYGMTSENVYLGNALLWVSVTNNIFWGGTYGFRGPSGVGYTIVTATNAYGNQSVAPTYGFSSSIPTSTLAQPYALFAPDISITANPFTAPGSGNFTLNSTAGGGAALKAAGFAGISPAGTGYLDIGALQSKAAASGSGVSPHAFVQ